MKTSYRNAQCDSDINKEDDMAEQKHKDKTPRQDPPPTPAPNPDRQQPPANDPKHKKP